MSVTKVVPSGLTDGQALIIDQTATVGNTFHTADAAAKDFIYMWAVNKHSADVKITIEFGGAETDQNITVDLEPNIPTPVLIGGLLTGSKTCKVFADTADVVSVWGHVDRHT